MENQTTGVLKPESLDSESWSLAEVAAWIIWRSKEHVASIIATILAKERHIQIFDVINEAARTSKSGMAPEGGVLPFSQAQAELWEQLRRGRLRAIGVRAGEAVWREVAPDAWQELDYNYCGTGQSNALGALGVVKYFDVTLPRTAVLTLWPLTDGAKNQSQRGRKRKIPQREVDTAVADLLDHHGDFSDDDPDWRTQSQLEANTRATLEEKFGVKNVPMESTLREYVRLAYRQWKAQKAEKSISGLFRP
jgi:hypothetical protein